MKKIVNSIAAVLYFIAGQTQNPDIQPGLQGEFCPNTTIVFTVSLATTNQNVSVIPLALNVAPAVVRSPYNIQTSNGVTTFNFDGRFLDINNKQTFQIKYKYGANNRDTTKNFTFVKIKSLAGASSFSQILPNLPKLDAPRCQVKNFNLSFPNVQYGNPFETPPIGYGTVTNYQYLLPAGWSLNGMLSTGNWMDGYNNVIITSDEASGINGSVKIRPVNIQCGPGLATGQEAVIPIDRPAPTLSLNGPDNVCTAATYSINGLPAGASVCWTSSNPSVISVPSQNCTNSVTVTKLSEGFATISATVTHCSFTYGPFTKVVAAGTPLLVYASTGQEAFNLTGQRFDYGANGPGRYFSVCTNESLTFTPYYPPGYLLSGVSSHQWSISGNYSFPSSLNQYALSVTSASSISNSFSFTYQYQNNCGLSPMHSGQAVTIDCDGGFQPFGNGNDLNLSLSPNPAKTTVNVSLKGVTGNYEMKIYDMLSGKLMKSGRYNKGQNQITLQISDLKPGLYIVQINQNGKIASKQLQVVR